LTVDLRDRARGRTGWWWAVVEPCARQLPSLARRGWASAATWQWYFAYLPDLIVAVRIAAGLTNLSGSLSDGTRVACPHHPGSQARFRGVGSVTAIART